MMRFALSLGCLAALAFVGTGVAQVPRGRTTNAPALPRGQTVDPSVARERTAPVILPGRQPDGSMLLPNQWSLRPVGRQVELGDFPVNIAVHPGSEFAAILHAGYGQHEIVVVSIPRGEIASRKPLKETFYGITFSDDGKRLYCSGAGDEVVHAFPFDNGKLGTNTSFRLRPATDRGVPAGLALDPGRKQLYVANVWGHRVTRVSFDRKPEAKDLLLDAAVPVAPLVPPPSDPDLAAITKRAEAALFGDDPAQTFPYACCLDRRQQRLYVSLWAKAQVAVFDVRRDRLVARWETQDHPCEMALTKSGRHLFVANANRNTVTVFDTERGQVIETIWAALHAQCPPGSTPNSLALSPAEDLLFVANADNNCVAVFDVQTPGRSRGLGFIPAGWYPTSVRVTPDGKHLLIANGKGLASRANPRGPQPGVSRPPGSVVEYIGGLFRGSLSILDVPSRTALLEALPRLSDLAYRGSPLRPDGSISMPRPPANPIPARPGDPTPIRYVIYIIKENRTYDQVLGDLAEGNGDPSLCLFPEAVTPNHHRLARQFVLLDNFYVESEVSADGHEWSMAAYATDFVEKSWPMSYGHGKSGKYPYPSEGHLPVASSSGGYLWDVAAEAGVSYRSYGEFVRNGPTPRDPGATRVKALEGHFDPGYRGFDMNYPDVERARRFIDELHRYELLGDMPRLQIMRLPNDHTAGASVGSPAPRACVADNDWGFGMVVEALSRSRFWPETAIFVVEDDAQNGPDHVDAHRTIAFVLSPWTKHGAVDSTPYSTSSMLRTMELILGLRPMSQFDAAARPMFNSFQSSPDLTPYAAVRPQVNMAERNTRQAWGSRIKFDFSKEDAADDLKLNEVIWKSVKGAASPMPAPVRAGFVLAHEGKEDDD